MIYAKKVQTTDARFKCKSFTISSGTSTHVLPVPDSIVACNGCNKNVYPDFGYLIYLDEQDLEEDLPYDFYCEDCTKEYFPKAKEVSND